jgi:hypothetical protein
MAARRMPFPWANLGLLALIVLELVTGVVGLLGASDSYRVLFWLHAAGAYAIVCLLFAKATIVYQALRRRPGVTRTRVTLGLLTGLLLAVLVTGLVWITNGPSYALGVSLVNLHAYLGVVLFALLAWHVVDRRWIVRVPPARDRAAFLRLAGVAGLGLVLWQAERALQQFLDTPGSRRRFTGSYERGSLTGVFPATSWLNDDPAPLVAASWRLALAGEVETALELDYDGLLERASGTIVATIDCTGGWYSTQEWAGVPLSRLLDEAGVRAGAKSVSVESVTGYGRRFSLDHARELILATHCAGKPLGHGHGFPARLVVPDERGYDWVKWVTRIRVLDSSHLLQPPLPLA